MQRTSDCTPLSVSDRCHPEHSLDGVVNHKIGHRETTLREAAVVA